MNVGEKISIEHERNFCLQRQHTSIRFNLHLKFLFYILRTVSIHLRLHFIGNLVRHRWNCESIFFIYRIFTDEHLVNNNWSCHKFYEPLNSSLNISSSKRHAFSSWLNMPEHHRIFVQCHLSSESYFLHHLVSHSHRWSSSN